MILENPKVPSDIWYALGLCYQRCGNLPKAKLSFEKTLELDSQNAMAMTSLGVLEQALSPNNLESRKRAVSHFMRAFEVNPRNPLVLKHLAEHLFFKNEFALCREFCKAAQEILAPKVRPDAERDNFRHEIELLKSNFCFILGKSDH
jgi:Tfp pilus assembly protein PilF